MEATGSADVSQIKISKPSCRHMHTAVSNRTLKRICIAKSVRWQCHDSPAGKRIRVESGARGKGKDAPSGLYQKWAKSQKRKVPGAGAKVDDAGAPDRYSKDLANRWARTSDMKQCMGF